MVDTVGFDQDVRLHVYRRFVETGQPPTVTQTAEALGTLVPDVEAAYLRLAQNRVLVLDPGSLRIRMAMPFSADPTAFRVESTGHRWWANCAWDALGVPALWAGDATIFSQCGDCEEPLTLIVERGVLGKTSAVCHFTVPAAHWWDDIDFT
jgi:hypothetical protein